MMRSVVLLIVFVFLCLRAIEVRAMMIRNIVLLVVGFFLSSFIVPKP